MKFDDFNYQVYNPYILVEDTLTELERKAGKSRKSNRQNELKAEEFVLTEDYLNKSVMEDYPFEPIEVKTEAEKVQEEERLEMERLLAEDKRLKEE